MQTTKATTLYTGADLHGKNVFLAICDEAGTSVFRRRVKNNLESINAALEPYWDRIKVIGVESTYNWYWFVDGLRAQGRNVKLGNPAKMQQYTGIKVTNDLTDAEWLAEQLRLNIFPECYIYPEEMRTVRDALRGRQLFVRRRTQVLLSFQSLIERYGMKAPTASQVLKWSKTDIKQLGLEPFVELKLNTLLSSIHNSDMLAKKIENEILNTIKRTDQYKRIQLVPGIGIVLGMFIMLESGDFTRFASAGNYASYCRTVRSSRTSNDKTKGRNNSKNGNKYLAWAFIEAATYAARCYPQIKSWYERKKRRRNVAVAKKALACKLSKSVWHVMNGKEFEMELMFG